ncbi:MAG: hypothetical protein HN590_07370 [Calditrichaeota bacterium]|nr:hypothetical protein [Calditrichota bacterium]
MKKRFNIFSIALITLFLLSTSIYAQPMKTGRALGLAGASGGAMFGVQAPGWNPANLGLSSNPTYSFYLPLSGGGSFGNNAFSPEYLTETFVKGAYLDDPKKLEILGKMEADDFKLYSYSGVPIFGVSVNSHSFNIESFVFLDTKIPRDIFDLILSGNDTTKSYNLSDVDSEVIGYATASYSIAKAFSSPHHLLREFSLGATFKYIYGIAGGVLDKHEGHILINNETIDASGNFRYLLSEKGDGVGLDLGAAGVIDPIDTYVGLTIGNLIGNISWTETEANQIEFSHQGGVEIDSLMETDYWKRFFNDSDTTFDAGDFDTPLPRYFLLSGQKTFLDDNVDVFLSWYQGLNESSGHSRIPKVSAGTELTYVKFMPIRFGLGLGGIESTQYSFGFGFNTPAWQMNIGMSWERGFAFGAEGMSFSLTNYFGQSYKKNKSTQHTLLERSNDFASQVKSTTDLSN